MGVVGSHEVAGPSDTKKLYGQMVSVQAVFGSTYVSQNVATLMPSLTSQSCSDSLPAVCLAGQVGAIYIQTTRGSVDARQAHE